MLSGDVSGGPADGPVRMFAYNLRAGLVDVSAVIREIHCGRGSAWLMDIGTTARTDGMAAFDHSLSGHLAPD